MLSALQTPLARLASIAVIAIIAMAGAASTGASHMASCDAQAAPSIEAEVASSVLIPRRLRLIVVYERTATA